MKFSINEAFKAALKIFSQNFFVVFFLSILSVVVIPLFLLLIQSLAMDFSAPLWDYFVAFPSPETLDAVVTTLRLSMSKQPWLRATASFVSWLVLLVSSLFMSSALLPAFAGHKIKFRDYFPDFKKVLNYFLGWVLIFVTATATYCIFVLVPFAYRFSASVSALLFLVFTVVSIVLSRYMIFFDIEILGGGQALKSLKNSSKLVSGNFCKILLLSLLVTLIVLILFGIVALIAALIGVMLFKSYLITTVLITVLIAILVTLPAAMLIIVPFFNLARIHVYTQLSLSKSNSLGNDD